MSKGSRCLQMKKVERQGFPIDSQLSKIKKQNLLQCHKSCTSSVAWYTHELLKSIGIYRAVKRLIASKIKVFVYIILYMWLHCV